MITRRIPSFRKVLALPPVYAPGLRQALTQPDLAWIRYRLLTSCSVECATGSGDLAYAGWSARMALTGSRRLPLLRGAVRPESCHLSGCTWPVWEGVLACRWWACLDGVVVWDWLWAGGRLGAATFGLPFGLVVGGSAWAVSGSA